MPTFLDRYERRDPFIAEHRRSARPVTGGSVDRVERFRDSDVYLECYEPRGIGHVTLIRIAGDAYDDPGMALAGIFRAPDQPGFDARDRRAIAAAVPALRAATRRARRLAPALRAQPVVEALLESMNPRPSLVLDSAGDVVWMSPRAALLLPPGDRGRPAVPEALVTAARRLADLTDAGRVADPPPATLTTRGRGPLPLRIELHVARTPATGRVLVAEIEDFSQPGPALADLAARGGLTRAETSVLGALMLGLTNRDVAQRLGVSVATVRTHVARILRKLDVSSRTEALLLARGGGPHGASGGVSDGTARPRRDG